MSRPGPGGCFRCGRRWYRWWGKRRRPGFEHVTYYEVRTVGDRRVASSGIFALCERCWSELAPAERLPFYRTLWSTWMQAAPDEFRTRELLDAWLAIREAVLAGG